MQSNTNPMQNNQTTLARILTFMGGFPFISAAIAESLALDVPTLDQNILSYSAVIIAFVCGIHWGLQLTQDNKVKLNLFLISNIVCLTAWSTLLFRVHSIHFIIHLICFVTLLIIDVRLFVSGAIDAWYYQLRKQITTVVSLSLIVLAYHQI